MRRLIGACGLVAVLASGCKEKEAGPNDPVSITVRSMTTTSIPIPKGTPPISKDDPTARNSPGPE